MFIKIMLYGYFFSFYIIKAQEYPFSSYKKIFHSKKNFEKHVFLESGHYVGLEYIKHLDPALITKLDVTLITQLDPALIRQKDLLLQEEIILYDRLCNLETQYLDFVRRKDDLSLEFISRQKEIILSRLEEINKLRKNEFR